MGENVSESAVRHAVATVVAANPERVAAWRRNERGSWGFLSGQAVVTCQRLLGRQLTETERRTVWEALWRSLLATRAAQPPGDQA